jgi:hypothetical protein
MNSRDLVVSERQLGALRWVVGEHATTLFTFLYARRGSVAAATQREGQVHFQWQTFDDQDSLYRISDNRA